MIEQFLQVAILFFKEIWFQLDSMFGIEETGVFQFLKPYLLQLQENPIYMGMALTAIILIPLGLYKIKNNTRERDRKLEELMEEMEDEEEYDESDPRRLRRTELTNNETELISENKMKNGDDKALSENKKEDQPSILQILEKLDEADKEDELHIDSQKVMGTEEEVLELEPISSELAEPDINKELNEFEDLEFDSEDRVEEDSIESETFNDNSIDGLHENELIELDDKEQDRAIEELQGEMESTINKLTEQLESDSNEGLSLEKNIEDAPQLESEAEPEEVSESLDIDEKLVLDKIEPEPLQPVPERNYSFESKPSAETESLINRLKYFQENLETISHHGNKEDTLSVPEPAKKDLLADPSFVAKQSFASKSPKFSPEDNKKYMEVLESFIFLKDQSKH